MLKFSQENLNFTLSLRNINQKWKYQNVCKRKLTSALCLILIFEISFFAWRFSQVNVHYIYRQ